MILKTGLATRRDLPITTSTKSSATVVVAQATSPPTAPKSQLLLLLVVVVVVGTTLAVVSPAVVHLVVVIIRAIAAVEAMPVKYPSRLMMPRFPTIILPHHATMCPTTNLLISARTMGFPRLRITRVMAEVAVA